MRGELKKTAKSGGEKGLFPSLQSITRKLRFTGPAPFFIIYFKPALIS